MSVYHSYCSILIGATCIVVTTQMLTVQFCKNGSYLHFARIKFSVGTFLKKPSLCCGCFTSKTILEENNKQTHMIIEHVRVIIQYHNPTTYH